MSLGEQIKALRTARSMTREDLGARIGVSGAYISMLESGKRSNPTRDVLRQLADALGVSVAELEGEQDILDGPWPAGQLRQLDLDPDMLLRYERLWDDLSRDDRAWLLGHLRIMAEAERRIRALEAEARDHPDGALPADTAGPPILVHLVS